MTDEQSDTAPGTTVPGMTSLVAQSDKRDVSARGADGERAGPSGQSATAHGRVQARLQAFRRWGGGLVARNTDFTKGMLSEASPQEEATVVSTVSQQAEKMTAREMWTEVVLAGAFAAILAILWWRTPPGAFAIQPVLACVVVLLLAYRVRIDTPFGFTSPIQLAFVPLLFAMPIVLVPIAVWLTGAAARIPEIMAGRMRVQRLASSLPNAWFTLGPVAVFSISHTAPAAAGPLLLVAALGAQVIVDFASSSLRYIAERDAVPTEILSDAWVYVIDAMLSGVALLAAIEIHRTILAVFALLPLLALMALFSRERQERLESLLELSRAKDELAFQALHDPVTGLANRPALMDRLEQALASSERRNTRTALFFLDLDDFKAVNDTYGHSVGDILLITVAERLQAAARRADTVARFGGDEFVLLCTDLAAAENAQMVGERFLAALSAPMLLGGQEIQVTGSLGGVVVEDSHADSGHLLRQVDSAMYQAKSLGRNRLCVIDANSETAFCPVADKTLDVERR